MALVPTRLTQNLLRWASRVLAQSGLGAALLGGVGCVGLDPFHHESATPMKTGAPNEVMVLWNRTVTFAPDPTKQGAMSPGLIGKFYALVPGDKEKVFPVIADGTVTVELYDDTQRGQPKPPAAKPLETWTLDKATLAKSMSKDSVGVGYTLFLPWGSYRPDTTSIRMKLSYTPANGGMPLYAAAPPIALDHTQTPQQLALRR